MQKRKEFFEFIRFIVIAAAIVIPLRAYVAQPFIVSGSSMSPTFESGEYLVIDELSYHFRAPLRGEVAVLRYPRNPTKFFIKRIIGLPGETVEGKGGEVLVTTADGDILSLDDSRIAYPSRDDFSRVLGEKEYFVMGDNRAASLDSRAWGPVKEELIKGRALVRLYPFTRLSFLPGYFNSKNHQ
jgi:signal peptidase I